MGSIESNASSFEQNSGVKFAQSREFFALRAFPKVFRKNRREMTQLQLGTAAI
jgi:hypothetical protein